MNIPFGFESETGIQENRHKRKPRRWAILLVFGLALIVTAFSYFWVTQSPLLYDGHPLRYWERQIATQPNHQAQLKIIPEMDEKAVPYWLDRLEEPNSILYGRAWRYLPKQVREMLPIPHNRYYSYLALLNLHVTNGIPKLVELTYSQDPELQHWAVNLLANYSHEFYEPDVECFKAFCHALNTGNSMARFSAVSGLEVPSLRTNAVPALISALEDPDDMVQISAATVVVRLRPDLDLEPLFQKGLTSTNSHVRMVSEMTLEQWARRRKFPK